MIITLYPELEEYIWQFCNHLKTDDEKMASKTASFYNLDKMDKKMLDFRKSKGWLSDEPHIKEMISGGFEQLKKNTIERILKHHSNELELNLCPACGKIARTPLAKQCRFCLHDWH